jgi:hypothetical protein
VRHVARGMDGSDVTSFDEADGTRRARGQVYLAALMAVVLLVGMGAVVTLVAMVLRATFLAEGLLG